MADLISHKSLSIQQDVASHIQRLRSKSNLSVSLEVALDYLQQLTQFDLGRFLLAAKGLNGFWTSYILIHGRSLDNLSPLENWLINSAPVVLATQARFKIFQQTTQSYLKNNMTIASIPCGLMDDLLRLDYSKLHGVRLVGIDLDLESIELAQANAKEHGVSDVEFKQKNAWDLGVAAEYDLITSNGLNIYQPDPIKVVDLYKNFYKALKPRGVLITSFLTPPPALSPDSPWKNYNQDEVLKQKVVLGEIVDVGFQTFATEQQARAQLENVGFSVVEVVYDHQAMFPTIVAQK